VRAPLPVKHRVLRLCLKGHIESFPMVPLMVVEDGWYGSHGFYFFSLPTFLYSSLCQSTQASFYFSFHIMWSSSFWFPAILVFLIFCRFFFQFHPYHLILFGSHSFDLSSILVFIFYICFNIVPIIWFHSFFISNLIFILLISYLLRFFNLLYFFFQFHHSSFHFVLFFYFKLGSYSFQCYLFYFYHFFNSILFSISSLNIRDCNLIRT